MSVFRRIGAFILDTIQTIVLSLSVFILVYLFLFQPHQVKGSSMYSTLHNGDFLLTNKITYRFKEPQRGDIIVFKAPKSEPCSEIECEYIKRLIGLPGDRVMISGGHIFVNGQRLNETYIAPDVVTNGGSFLPEGVEKIIPDGFYLPIGDNRPFSRDGREFGPIDRNSIIGKAWLRYWPLNKIGIIKHPNFE